MFCLFFFKQKTAYDMRISDWSSDVCSSDLAAARDKLLAAATKDPRLAGVRIFGQKDVGQLQIDVDKALAGAHGLTQADVNDTISTAWGGAYVNDFIDRGRVKRVSVQADATYRRRPEVLGLLRSEERRLGKEWDSMVRSW